MRFFLLDRVDTLEIGVQASGIKNLTLSDEVFFDHFPQEPVFPGTLLVEAMAQLAGFLAETSYHALYPDTRRAVLMKIDRAAFHRACRPGDQIRLSCRMTSLLSAAAQLDTLAEVNGEPVAKARLSFRLLAIEAPQLHRQRLELYDLWTRELKPRPVLR